MKLKELAYMLGMRPAARTYGYEIVQFDLAGDGKVEYARWLHPREAGRTISQGEINELRKFLKPGDVAIDVGAHTGDSTIPMALAVGSDGLVLALEPNPYVFPVLEKNSRLNVSKTNIVPLMFAATPSDGELVFEYADPGFCNGGRHDGISRWRHGHAFALTVPGRNLENYLRAEHSDIVGHIRYIKIDAEGFDFGILKSISGLIREARPFLRAEVFSRMPRPAREAMIGFLENLGYSVHRVVSDEDYVGERVSASDVMRWRHFDVFCVPERTSRDAARGGG